MTTTFDSPEHNDNRSYDYSSHTEEDRYEYAHVAHFIDPKSRVVDLGCGNGSLMVKIACERASQTWGVELSESGVAICRSKGLNVIQASIDRPLPFKDDEFDYAVCNVTMQMVMYPEILLREMKRISRRQIISFPNFGNWKNRLELVTKGRMPHSMLYGYDWYSTGHIHQFSIDDFHALIALVGGLSVVDHYYQKGRNPLESLLMTAFPNLFQKIPIFLLEKTE